MAHPRTYHDGDPFLGDLRKVCLALPEAVEVEAWGRPTFRAGKKIFAVFTGSDEERYAVVFQPEPDERRPLSDDARIRQVALKRMLARLDDARPSSSG